MNTVPPPPCANAVASQTSDLTPSSAPQPQSQPDPNTSQAELTRLKGWASTPRSVSPASSLDCDDIPTVLTQLSGPKDPQIIAAAHGTGHGLTGSALLDQAALDRALADKHLQPRPQATRPPRADRPMGPEEGPSHVARSSESLIDSSGHRPTSVAPARPHCCCCCCCCHRQHRWGLYLPEHCVYCDG